MDIILWNILTWLLRLLLGIFLIVLLAAALTLGEWLYSGIRGRCRNLGRD